MIHWIGDLESKVLEYVRDSLRDGLWLARTVGHHLAELDLDLYAVVPVDPGPARLAHLREGGIGRSVIGRDVAQDLQRRFPAGELVVEVPLARPTDRSFNSSDQKMYVYIHEDVYAVCALSAETGEVERTLREVDPSYNYNAIILGSRGKLTALLTQRGPVKWEELDIRAVIVGAYDGEGLIAGLAAPNIVRTRGDR